MPRHRRFGSTQKHSFISGTYVVIALFLVLFQVFSSIFALPILIGFFFCYMFILLREKERTLYDLDFRWYFSMFYLVFIDITHNLYLFSSWIAFFVFYYLFADWIKTNFKVGKVLPILFTFCAYGLLFIVDNVINYVQSGFFKLYGGEYIADMLAESALCYLFFRNKLK